MPCSIVVLLCFLTQEEMKHVLYPIDAKVLHRTLRNRRDAICDFFFGKEYAKMVDKDWKLLELIQNGLSWNSFVDRLLEKREDEVLLFINKAREKDPDEYGSYCNSVKATFFQQ